MLLNGAEEKHQIKENYRKSRGLIVIDLISNDSVLDLWETIQLEGIEPFTLVLFEKGKLYQLRWNEIVKSKAALDTNKSHIWSSSTLYHAEIRAKRATWFYDFLDSFQNNTQINEDEIFHFHRYTETDNAEHGLVINRNDILKTLSITQTVIEKNKAKIHYADLISETDFYKTFISI